MKHLKRILSALLAVVMIASMVTVIGAADLSFTDVADHWAWTGGQIPYLVEKNVLNGYKQPNGTYLFKPNGEVTRAEFIKMLDETFGLTATAPISFSDISASDWYCPYFQKAAAQGYLLNYGNTASPNGKITRQEAASLLVRYLDLPANETASASTFADYSEIADHFKEYILRAYYANIINGYDENGRTYFKPQKTLTRAEALTILYRAAGCIFNQNAYSRDGGAPANNNVITRGNIGISRVNFTGRNILSEGAESGTVTLTDCNVTGTLYVRGGADLKLDGTRADEIVVSGGGNVSLVQGSKIGKLVLLTPSNVSIGSANTVETLDVRIGAKNVNVTGDGSVGHAIIGASGFKSAMTPAEFEIENNLSAAFAGVTYSGSSSTQSVFTVTPFLTADDEYYYLNVLPEAEGTLYYYFTNDVVKPAASAFDSVYELASYADFAVLKSDDPVTIRTFSKSAVSKYSNVVLQLQGSGQKYAPVVIANTPSTGSGFASAPAFDGSNAVKFKTESSGVVYGFYADSGKQLTSAEFLGEYYDTDSSLRFELSITSMGTYNCQLNASCMKKYDYAVFLFRSNKGLYYTPVVVSIGDSGFTEGPSVTTPGTISFKADVTGKLYFYYSETADLPSADAYSAAWNKAEESGSLNVTKGRSDSFKYDTREAEDYPFLILALQNSSKEYLQPVAVAIDFTTGFSVEPEINGEFEVRFKTESSGDVKYYYTKSSTAPSVSEFITNYNNAASRYKGTKAAGSYSYSYIDYDQSIAASYPYMVLMFTDGTKKEYSPVIVELDAVSQTGFVSAPYVKDGVVHLKVEGDGEIFYYYDRSYYSCSASDFYEYWDDASYYGTIDADRTELELDTKALRNNKYLYLAFLPEKYAEKTNIEDYFSYPYVLDIENSERSSSGSGIADYFIYESSEKVDITPKYSGYLYYYLTDSKSDLPTDSLSFENKYNKSSDSDYEKVYKDEETTLKTYDSRYLVVCLEVDDEFMDPIVIDMGSRAIYDDDIDDGSNKSGYGMTSIKVMSDGTIRFLPEYDGTVTLFALDEDGDRTVLDSVEVEEDELAYLEVPFSGGSSSLISILLGGSDIYLQLKSGSSVYRAYEVDLY